ncbi:steroidogenic acute regulatory protein-like isoform X1 [Cephus cinctus]|uniref:Steroidogenic acute regulatory protein-like isoform X1 n=1 Tax=Cephus cinctus TaxID=211228 RepID=A0AAJ7W6Z1_CEPCN|nr:steroidogenic acute regulatory protein-like isoform X1 [Cephus cinctus]XP_015607385.1 steroidogenic acute regulatory protein-like isoform X1 [Cephus cinctus]XP_015607386.1 steroidogenic acute regulatory protein-like isoform X1 [Cephus cinctus]XP_024946701.1 steroidogenic acute regulatory protein-like isoform X1 [Cephus cinctus]
MSDEDRQIRAAAEAILTGSVQSQRSSFTQHSVNRTPDIVVSEDLIAGARHRGRMSNVRRFFCLFVTFDLLFTCLMWLICTTLTGDNVETAFIKQVVHYQIKTSLFDIVMAAVCRFTVLLLFYGLLYINHWCIIALSTTATCAFLIAKVFLFDWSQSSQPVFQVLLVLTSFVLAWGEAWFFDFRVIPQETQARDWILGVSSFDSERAPLLGRFLTGAGQYTESVANFYTPMDTPDRSDDEDYTPRQNNSRRSIRTSEEFVIPILPRLSRQKVDEYKRVAAITLDRAYELLMSSNWKDESITTEGDVISSMSLPKPDGRIFKITGIIDVPAWALLDDLFKHIEAIPSWNRLVAESKKIQPIDENTDIVYQATSAQGGGMVSARDFVILRRCGKKDDFFISCGTSIQFSPIPVRKGFVRGENGVGCWATENIVEDENKCRFTWIMNTNLKGWLPPKVVEASLSTALIEFMSLLREHASTLRSS